jgi:CRISPR/Cas system-associated protein Cas10 (large subunit of type III CRISPR-Cas system)
MTERARVGRQILEMADTPSKIIDNAQFAGKTQSSIFENITKSNSDMRSSYRKPSLGGPNPERRQLSFRGQEVTTLRELETKQAEQAESKSRKLLPTIYDPQKAPGGYIF